MRERSPIGVSLRPKKGSTREFRGFATILRKGERGWKTKSYKVVIHTKLEPMKTVARTIKERLPNVVSYCTHRIANAAAEGMNSKITSIKRRVGGFRNIDNFKTAIFFYCGGLDVYPR